MVVSVVTLLCVVGFAVIVVWFARNLTLMRLGDIHTSGVEAMGLQKHDEAAEILSELLRQAQTHPRGRDFVVAALTFLAAIHEIKGESAESRRRFEEAAAARQRSSTRLDGMIASNLARLSEQCATRRLWAAAESLASRALELAEQSPGAGEEALVACLLARARLETLRRRPDAAAPLLERAWSIAAGAFGPTDDRTADAQERLAAARWQQRRFDEAAGLFDDQIRSQEKVVEEQQFVPDRLPRLLRSRGALAEHLGQLDRAAASYERAVRLCELTQAEDESLAKSITARGNLYVRLGRLEEAESDLRRATGLCRPWPFMASDDETALDAMVCDAWLRWHLGRHKDAIRLASRVLAKTGGPELDPLTALYPVGGHDRDVAPAAEAPQTAEAPEEPALAQIRLEALTVLARSHFDLGHMTEAEASAAEAVALARRLDLPSGRSLGRNLHRLALIAAQCGDQARAADYFRQAVAAYEALPDQSDLHEVLRDRERLLGGAG